MDGVERDIEVMVVEADKHPYMSRIPDSEANIEWLVGGEVEMTLQEGKGVALLYDKDAFSKGREPNRVLFDKEGEPCDILCGIFIVAGWNEEGITSLSKEKALEYYNEFKQPTFFGLEEKEEKLYEFETQDICGKSRWNNRENEKEERGFYN